MTTKKGLKIKCSNCETEIWETLLKCPECGTLTKRGKNVQIGRIVLLPIALVALIIAFFVMFTPTSSSSPPPESQPGVTLAQFEAVKTGMNYYKVCAIFGFEGELISQVDIGIDGYETKVYSWPGYGTLGANCNVTFQNDKVVAKAQFGLQ